MKLPSSVMNVAPSGRWRSFGFRPNAASFRVTTGKAIWITSTGNGKRPSCLTSLLESAITMNFRAALATIFSRNNAPPPPLMRASPGPTSSAPSTAKSSTGESSKVMIGMESDSASRRLAVEVAMPRTRSPCFTRSPSSSMNILEVVPLPSPAASHPRQTPEPAEPPSALLRPVS